MRRLHVIAGLVGGVVAGCGAGDGGPIDDCVVSISFSPMAPIPGTQVIATAIVQNITGVPDYAWMVSHGGSVPFSAAQPDLSAIAFTPDVAGSYQVNLDVTVGGQFCPSATKILNVGEENPGGLNVRLHVQPPPELRLPPLDKRLSIPGGADLDISPVTLDPGVPASGMVTAGTGVAAYLRLAPAGMLDAPVETFSGADGAFSVRMLDQPHDVLVIPTDIELAPQVFSDWNPGDPALQLVTGDTVTGFVRDAANAGIANAKVQLVVAGVPSAIGSTTATGAFSLHAVTSAGADTTILVTPPVGSGLPRLEATATFALSQPINVRYATFPIRNLAGVHVRRGGVAQPGAKVTLVGKVAGAATITNGVISDNATAVIHVTATADGTGALPPTAVPGLPATAVVAVAPADPTGDLAVTSVDLGTGVPADIVAPPMIAFTTRGLGPTTGTGIDSVTLDLVPRDRLADAGAPILHFTGSTTGAISGLLPSGGHYDARWSDRDGAGAPITFTDTTASTIAGAYTLPKALLLTGTLSVPGNPNPVPRASVQILCRDCQGLDRDRPIAEVASDEVGSFAIALPDPGTL